MMTNVLDLPEVTDGQASQGVIHNRALRQLEAKNVRVLSRTTTAQPGSPADGDAYILAATHTGTDWGGATQNQIAHYIGGVWQFYTPKEGWRVWVNNENQVLAYDGSSWGQTSSVTRWPCVAVSSSSFSVTAAHRGTVLVCDTSGGNVTLNLLAAATAGNDFVFAVKKKVAANSVIIDPSGAELIDDATTVVLTADEDSRIVVTDASEWHSIGGGGTGGGGGATQPFSDLTAMFKNDADPSKSVRVVLDGISPGFQRDVNFPDKDGTFAYLDDVPAGGIDDNQLAENSAGHVGNNYAYFAGYIRSFTALTFVAGGTVACTHGATNYVECSATGTVSANTTGFTAGRFPMAIVVVAAGSPSAITSVSDRRTWIFFESANPATCSGRLTLESGVAASASDQTAKTNVYFTPYKGNRISLYTTTGWISLSFSEVTLALGTLTADKNYDVFAYASGSSVVLELSAAWSSDSARADALTTQDGVPVKSGATTRRYLGTIRTTSTTTTEDSLLKRFVWNNQNRLPRGLIAFDSTASWTYSTASYRQANNSAVNQIGVLIGLREDYVNVVARNLATNSTSTARNVRAGIGINSTTVNSSTSFLSANASSVVIALPSAEVFHIPALGYSLYTRLEYGGGADTQTWSGGIGGPLISATVMG